jgi:hypothetical protein
MTKAVLFLFIAVVTTTIYSCGNSEPKTEGNPFATDGSTTAAAAADGEASVVGDGEPETQRRRGRGPGRKQLAARAASMKFGAVEEDTCVDE